MNGSYILIPGGSSRCKVKFSGKMRPSKPRNQDPNFFENAGSGFAVKPGFRIRIDLMRTRIRIRIQYFF
jgi:hypothetical protein